MHSALQKLNRESLRICESSGATLGQRADRPSPAMPLGQKTLLTPGRHPLKCLHQFLAISGQPIGRGFTPLLYTGNTRNDARLLQCLELRRQHLCVMPGRARRICAKCNDSSESSKMTRAFHFPPTTANAVSTGQGSKGDRFSRYGIGSSVWSEHSVYWRSLGRWITSSTAIEVSHGLREDGIPEPHCVPKR